MKLNNYLRIALFLVGILYATHLLNAQSREHNYIAGRTFKDNVCSRTELCYYDGLGRLSESLSLNASPTGKHHVFLYEYDGLGREVRQWLPFPVTSTDSDYVPVDVLKNGVPLIYSDRKPYSLNEYEPSPLNRVSRRYGPGMEWQDKEKGIGTEYLSSLSSIALYSCLYYEVENFPNDMSVRLSCKPVSCTDMFRVTLQRGEDGEETLNFTNGRGETVLTRQVEGNISYDTYYVHDLYGNLRVVLPPMASDLLDTSMDDTVAVDSILSEYAYLYQYDSRHRCIAKKLPGCEWIYYVYDTADRLIFMQDGVCRSRGEWVFTIPDMEGRVCLKGICRNDFQVWNAPLGTSVVGVAKVAAGLCDTVGLGGSGYSVTGFSLVSPTLLAINYYDDYSFLDTSLLSAHKVFLLGDSCVSGFSPISSCIPRGLPTGAVYMCLDGDSAVSINCSVSYYDSLERIVQTKSLNHRGGYDMSYLSYNLSGELLAEERIHHACNGEEPLTERFVYTYDLMGRLLTTSCQLNDSSPFLLADNKYDELGHLQRNKRNGHPSMQTEYSYNVRSWLSKLSGPLFAQKLYYNDGMGIARYNGNISAMTCQYGSESSECGYKFEYDGLNRLTNAFYGEGSALSSNSHRFDEQVTDYDKQGNILGLLRYGRTSLSGYGLIDNLNLTYHGNQLQSVYDNATNSAYGNGMDFKDGASQSQEYVYDANGNLIQDLNKNITCITYNCLNLPSRIEFGDGNSISYVYDAEGTKLRTTHIIGNDTTLTDYCGNLIYENGVAKTLLVEGGYISLSDNKYHFYFQDHQGNNRVVADENGTIEEVNDYYPFGGTFASSSGSVQPYKYNGKELDRKNGLDWYDYGARHYDPVLGRFMTVDPMAEEYYSISLYAYCLSNPIKLIDPDGKAAQIPPFFLGTANPLVTTGSRMTMLGTADKVVKALPKEEHHIIPRSLGKHDVVKAAREGGFKLEGKENKMTVDKFSKATGEGQHGKHPKYTEQLRKEFEKYAEGNPNASPEQSANFVRGKVSNAKNAIENNPNTKVNDLELKSLTLPTDGIKVTKPLEPIKPVKAINPWDA